MFSGLIYGRGPHQGAYLNDSVLLLPNPAVAHADIGI